MLALGAPFPMVVLPVDGEFWMEGTYHVLSRDMNDRPIYPSIDMSRCTINEDNNSVLEYRKHFAGRVRMVYVMFQSVKYHFQSSFLILIQLYNIYLFKSNITNTRKMCET